MSEKEKKSAKKKSKKLLSFPSFRRPKKLNQIKEEVCLDLKDETSTDLGDNQTRKHGSSNSIPSLGLDATLSLDSPRKDNSKTDDNERCEAQGSSTPYSERRSFSNLRSAYLDNPDFVRNAVSPGVRRLGLGGSYNLSTDSGIDCSILLSEKGSPERFQEFTRREAERIHLEHLQSVEHLQSLNNSLPQEQSENAILEVDQDSAIVGGAEASANTLEEKIEQTKEHITLLSELRTVLEQKLEACNRESVDLETSGNKETLLVDLPDTDNMPNSQEETMNNHSPTNGGSSTERSSDSHLVDPYSQSGHNTTENYNLLLHTNKTDERKSEEARMRLENLSPVVDSLVIDSPHLIVSPSPVMSLATTANHRILPSTPSPTRLYVNEKSAFAKCKSLKRSVSDVGKGLLGKLRQKKKYSDETKHENNLSQAHGALVSEDLVENIKTEQDNERDRLSDCSTFSAHLETSLLCDNSPVNSQDYDIASMSWEMSNLNASIESSYETDSVHMEPNISDTRQCDLNGFDSTLRGNIDHSQGSISAIQELTTSICEMTSKLKLSPSQRSSANSIDCMCNCRNRDGSPHCCERSKPPSPFNMDSGNLSDKLTETENVIKDESTGKSDTICNYGLNIISDNRNALKQGDNYYNGENDSENEIVPTETDSLLGNNCSRNSQEITIKSKPSNRSEGLGTSKVNERTKALPVEMETAWFNDDTEGDSDDSSCSYCSGCSDEECSGGVREKRKLKFGSDSSSGDTSPNDFNTGSSGKSSDSESDSSGLEGTPEKLKWQDASFNTDITNQSPYSVSYMELNVDGLEPVYLNTKARFERCYNLPTCSPQSNYPSPEVSVLPSHLSKTPASSPMLNFDDELNGSPVPTSQNLECSPTQNIGGCRRKDTYQNLSPEYFESQSLLSLPRASTLDRKRTEASFSRNSRNRCSESSLNVSYMTARRTTKNRSESDLNMSGLNLMNSRGNCESYSDFNVKSKPPVLVKDKPESPIGPLDLSIRKEPKNPSESLKKKSAFWMDKHVGQVFSPAKIVLHKNRDVSETDLCRNILDSYISDADESGFDPDFENSFANSINNSMSGSMSFNSSLNMSNTFNSSLNASSIVEQGSSDEDSMLQYGTYVAPRQPKKETNVDDFSTTLVSSCYTAEAKTRKLQGGADLNASRDCTADVGSTKAPAHTRPVMSRSRTSHRGRPYNPVHYQSGRRRHISLPDEESFTEIHERMRVACNDEKVRVKGRRETDVGMDAESNKQENERVKVKSRRDKDLDKSLKVFEDRKERIRVKGRREMRDEQETGTEILEDSLTLERVKGRREIREGVQSDTDILQDSIVLMKGRREIGKEIQADTETDQESVPKERVKGRRETGDMVLLDRTNTKKQPALQVEKSSEKCRSAPSLKMADGKENVKLLDLSDTTFDRLTVMHTAHNGKRKVRCLSVYEAQSIVKHYPPPKQASSISWGQNLSEMDLLRHTPRKTPIKTKPILVTNKDPYPYEDDSPSPIVLTRLRRSKSLSKKFKNWPW